MISKIMLKRGGVFLFALFAFSSCEEFFHPSQGLIVPEDEFLTDWSEYRAAELGLYSLQQELIDQLVVLGELRGDLLEITDNADNDLIEIYNFNISKENKYASPYNFYKLIAACNKLALALETNRPEISDFSSAPNSYDRLYGEVLSMRAWAYFNAVRIYGKIPYIWPSLTTVVEIEEYVNGSYTYIDSFDIVFHLNGYDNDTIYNQVKELDKTFIEMPALIDTLTEELTTKVKTVGVIHHIYNGDLTWDATVWNQNAYKFLLGQLYLYEGDLTRSLDYFYHFLYNTESETSSIKYGLDKKFSNKNWKNIFTGIDLDEHIYTLWFNRTYQQQNGLQSLFSLEFPNKYQLKPSGIAIKAWESVWDEMIVTKNLTNPNLTITEEPGKPGDFYRGHGVSFGYIKNGFLMENNDAETMLEHKRLGNTTEVENMMNGVDTVVYKYTIGKNSFDSDANFIVYRAASAHLYAAEIYTYLKFDDEGVIKTNIPEGILILNNGSYAEIEGQLGVRGRVGFGDGDEAISSSNVIYEFDPFTNQIIGYTDYTGNLPAKQQYLEEKIIDERALELAYEGERFYDLIRVAKRRNDNSYLADKVAEKFKGPQKEVIRARLMDETNWYINYFDNY